jgi:NAD(P)-dependent dehydrogenase (short-subunit alcohol dehydrogenase family)
MEGTMQFKDKIAIITGAASGLGEKIALTLSEEGSKVVLTDINETDLQALRIKIETEGGKVIAVPTDVSKSQEVNRMVENTIEAFGKIDILVNCAGIARDAYLGKMTDEAWNEVITVNLSGTFYCCRAVIPHMMAERTGKIINISSAAYLGNIGIANYGASKAGVLSLTRILALEAARFGINVNAIAPGVIDTPMSRKYPEQIRKRLIGSIPIEKAGLPQDIANAVIFLSSEQASYITGQTLFVDGGMSIGKNPL